MVEATSAEMQCKLCSFFWSMDSEGMLAIFQRSVEQRNAKPITFLFKKLYMVTYKLLSLNVFGHVQKQQGLKVMVTNNMARNDSLAQWKRHWWERGVTDKLNDKLQVHFGKAIRH